MIRRERRDGREGEERGLRKGAERREKRQKVAELTICKEHQHLPMLVVQLPQGTEFPTRFRSKALQHSTLKY